MSHLIVEIKLLHPDARKPEYQTAGASGMDLHAFELDWDRCEDCADETEGPMTIFSNGRAMINTGIAVAIPPGWEGQVRPRSSLSKKGILCQLGTIDSDYRGEIKVCLQNLSGEPYEIKRGDRIAQLVFAPVGRATLQSVERFSTETERGEGGFGSTDRRKA